MSTNYEHSDGADHKAPWKDAAQDTAQDTAQHTAQDTTNDAGTSPTEAVSGESPTEPIADTHQTEPIRDSYPTNPIPGTDPTEPAGAEGKPASATAPRAEDTPDHEPVGKQPRPRAGTVVWGLIVIALAVLLILGQVASISLNMGQVVIGLLLGAGLALVIGGIISAGNREKDDKRA